MIFKNAEIVLRKNPGKKKYEIEFLLNSFKKNQRESNDYQLLISEFKIENSQFYHLSKNSIEDSKNIDIQHFKLFNLNLLLNNTSLDNNLFFSKISDLKFQHEKGFNISRVNADLYLDSTKLNLVNLKLETPNSTFNSDNIILNLDFKNDFLLFENMETRLSSIDYNLFFNRQLDTTLKLNFNTSYEMTVEKFDTIIMN